MGTTSTNTAITSSSLGPEATATAATMAAAAGGIRGKVKEKGSEERDKFIPHHHLHQR